MTLSDDLYIPHFETVTGNSFWFGGECDSAKLHVEGDEYESVPMIDTKQIPSYESVNLGVKLWFSYHWDHHETCLNSY